MQYCPETVVAEPVKTTDSICHELRHPEYNHVLCLHYVSVTFWHAAFVVQEIMNGLRRSTLDTVYRYGSLILSPVTIQHKKLHNHYLWHAVTVQVEWFPELQLHVESVCNVYLDEVKF